MDRRERYEALRKLDALARARRRVARAERALIAETARKPPNLAGVDERRRQVILAARERTIEDARQKLLKRWSEVETIEEWFANHRLRVTQHPETGSLALEEIS